MSTPLHFESRDLKNANVHLAMTAVEQELTKLSGSGAPDGTYTQLRAVWTELVNVLAVDAVPALRECPGCKAVGMQAATICGSCWIKLTPPTD